jgi:restriction system protein
MRQNWMIRAEGGTLIEMFLTKKIAAIGWSEMGDLSQYSDKSKMLQGITEAWPMNKPGTNRNILSILFRFVNDISLSDNIITYEPSKRIYHIGRVLSEYRYDANNSEWPNVLDVKWEHEIQRDGLSVNSKNILGSTLTLFSVPDEVFNEIENLIGNEKNIQPAKETAPVDEENILEDIQAKSFEFIKDKISALDWEDMQRLVGGLLRSMGYKTKISPRGADLGKDIIASPDGFGLGQPRIVVEVKHRNQPVDSAQIRSFLGGRHKDDKGLYVSTGGFRKDAKYEAERASIPLTLFDIDDLVTEILANYEDMDIETKLLLPLTKFYWPK